MEHHLKEKISTGATTQEASQGLTQLGWEAGAVGVGPLGGKPNREELDEVLQKIFRHRSFREHQRECVENTLEGRDVLLVMATGSGKSLLYQLPPVLLHRTAVVVSPLLALMQNQIRQCQARGIQAAMISGLQNAAERKEILAKLVKRPPQISLLYVSPEFVDTPFFRDNLASFLPNICLFAIDEAHCISEWGTDFRPTYRRLSVLKEVAPDVPVLALTATATPRIARDVSASLKLSKPARFAATFNRPNIQYEVRFKELLPDSPVVVAAKEDASTGKGQPMDQFDIEDFNVVDDMRTWISDNCESQAGIVYCSRRRDTEQISKLLNKRGVRSSAYHAGMTNQTRKEVLEGWCSGHIAVVVATIAFGMGINKHDVRFVIHHTIPSSMEGFYQQSGRAGRDGKPAFSLLYYSPQDAEWNRRNVLRSSKRDSPAREQGMGSLKAIEEFAWAGLDVKALGNGAIAPEPAPLPPALQMISGRQSGLAARGCTPFQTGWSSRPLPKPEEMEILDSGSDGSVVEVMYLESEGSDIEILEPPLKRQCQAEVRWESDCLVIARASNSTREEVDLVDSDTDQPEQQQGGATGGAGEESQVSKDLADPTPTQHSPDGPDPKEEGAESAPLKQEGGDDGAKGVPQTSLPECPVWMDTLLDASSSKHFVDLTAGVVEERRAPIQQAPEGAHLPNPKQQGSASRQSATIRTDLGMGDLNGGESDFLDLFGFVAQNAGQGCVKALDLPDANQPTGPPPPEKGGAIESKSETPTEADQGTCLDEPPFPPPPPVEIEIDPASPLPPASPALPTRECRIPPSPEVFLISSDDECDQDLLIEQEVALAASTTKLGPPRESLDLEMEESSEGEIDIIPVPEPSLELTQGVTRGRRHEMTDAEDAYVSSLFSEPQCRRKRILHYFGEFELKSQHHHTTADCCDACKDASEVLIKTMRMAERGSFLKRKLQRRPKPKAAPKKGKRGKGRKQGVLVGPTGSTAPIHCTSAGLLKDDKAHQTGQSAPKPAAKVTRTVSLFDMGIKRIQKE